MRYHVKLPHKHGKFWRGSWWRGYEEQLAIDERAAKGNEKKRGAKDIGKNLAPKRKQVCIVGGAAKARF